MLINGETMKLEAYMYTYRIIKWTSYYSPAIDSVRVAIYWLLKYYKRFETKECWITLIFDLIFKAKTSCIYNGIVAVGILILQGLKFERSFGGVEAKVYFGK